MSSTDILLGQLVLLLLIGAVVAWLGVRGWRRSRTNPPRNIAVRYTLYAVYAYLIGAGGVVLWMFYAEKVGGHLALALCCAAIAIPAFLAGLRER